jgi:hypothetical protein
VPRGENLSVAREGKPSLPGTVAQVISKRSFLRVPRKQNKNKKNARASSVRCYFLLLGKPDGGIRVH